MRRLLWIHYTSRIQVLAKMNGIWYVMHAIQNRVHNTK